MKRFCVVSPVVLFMLTVLFTVPGRIAYAEDASRRLVLYSQIMESHMNDMVGDGRTMGDTFTTNNQLHSSPGGALVALAETSLVVTKSAANNDGLERRLFRMIMTWPNGRDSIVIEGISIASVPDDWMRTAVPSYRAITGGTGRFAGARGEAIFTRTDATWVKIRLRFDVLQ